MQSIQGYGANVCYIVYVPDNSVFRCFRQARQLFTEKFPERHREATRGTHDVRIFKEQEFIGLATSLLRTSLGVILTDEVALGPRRMNYEI
jgi:hypothetical protein